MKKGMSAVEWSTKFSEFLSVIDSALSVERTVPVREFREFSRTSLVPMLIQRAEMLTEIYTLEPCVKAVVLELTDDFDFMTATAHYSMMRHEERRYLDIKYGRSSIDLSDLDRTPDSKEFQQRWATMALRFGKDLSEEALGYSEMHIQMWHDPRRFFTAILEELVDHRTDQILMRLLTVTKSAVDAVTKDRAIFMALEMLEEAEPVEMNLINEENHGVKEERDEQSSGTEHYSWVRSSPKNDGFDFENRKRVVPS